MCDIRIAGIINDSITDGPGLRYTIFVQGCPHHCEGCHNPQTWNFNGGKTVLINNLIDEINSNPLIKGVTFSGGEPLCQAKELLPLAQFIKEKNLNLAIYTGFTFEEIIQNNDMYQIQLLKLANILIDGKFELNKKDYRLKFRGSSNQRIIDLCESFKQNKVIINTSNEWNNNF